MGSMRANCSAIFNWELEKPAGSPHRATGTLNEPERRRCDVTSGVAMTGVLL